MLSCRRIEVATAEAGHSLLGEQPLRHAPALASLRRMAPAHHERAEGTGNHGRATATPLGADTRILAVANCFHGLTEHRPTGVVAALSRRR
jgi:HD-GYP domain-containing protein (c-di-GMP phosphodiesterase class II)